MGAEGLNRVTLIGNLGQDPELRFTQGGQPILNMRLAVNESWFDKESKEKKERVEWVSCTLWGKRGESLSKFLGKGSRICVEGKIQTRSWEGKDGTKRYTTEVNATNILLLGSKGEGGGGRSRGGSGEHEGVTGQDAYGGGGDEFDDQEIPF